MHNPFYRNVRARDHLNLFLIGAVSTVLALRLFLYITGYPQVGGHTLHIAHMLYGALFMMMSIVLMIAFLGERIRRFSAGLGGVGFGLIVDELGKFITKDNNYFFRPTIGLIYAIFVIIFLVFNYLGRQKGRLTDREYELNALNQVEEAILQDLDPIERQRIIELLSHVSKPTVITEALRTMLETVKTVPEPKPGPIKRVAQRANRLYANFWERPSSGTLIGIIFVGQALFFLGTVVYAVFTGFDNSIGLNASNGAYANRLLVAEFISSSVSGGYAIAGAIRLLRSRHEAYNFFRISLTVNVLLTEFFIFSRIQFGALPGFIVNLALLAALQLAQYQEKYATIVK